jgi:hypothetical protein
MKIMSFVPLINKAFQYVIKTSKQYNIDESHAVKHSIDVFQYANKIYDSEVLMKPFIREQKDIIFVSSIVHDMCDKKYFFDEKNGLDNIETHFKDDISKPRLDVILNIISTMSYSKVKKMGFPDLKEYQLAYHIVREADLLDAYDFDRCIIYHLNNIDNNINNAFKNALYIFNNRIFTHNDDNIHFDFFFCVIVVVVNDDDDDDD